MVVFLLTLIYNYRFMQASGVISWQCRFFWDETNPNPNKPPRFVTHSPSRRRTSHRRAKRQRRESEGVRKQKNIQNQTPRSVSSPDQTMQKILKRPLSQKLDFQIHLTQRSTSGFGNLIHLLDWHHNSLSWGLDNFCTHITYVYFGTDAVPIIFDTGASVCNSPFADAFVMLKTDQELGDVLIASKRESF